MVNPTAGVQARYVSCPAFALDNGKKETAAQAAGRRYEEKALLFLEVWAKGNRYSYIEKPWIQYFNDQGRLMWCQPDALLLSETDDNLLIVEVKVRHTRDAFTQLARYRPLILELHPKFKPSCLELCRYFDPDEFATTLFPALRPHDLPHAAVVWEPQQFNLNG